MNHQNKYQIVRHSLLIAQKWQDRANGLVEKELGLTTKQWMLLTNLEDEFEGHLPTLSEVTDSFGTSRQNIKRLIVELQNKGYLIIANDPGDSRVLRIALTGKHKEFYQKNRNIQLLELLTEEYFQSLEEEELAEFEKTVNKIFDQISISNNM